MTLWKKSIRLSATLILSTTPLLAQTPEKPSKPNIILMMVDDLGFSDFGCYGSEIETPNIDRLADNGIRFSQFYNTAKCHTSRISLLTGLYPNQAGNKFLTRSTTIPTVLKSAGYTTSMSGKWHLDKQPTDFGFQRFWGHLSGATDYFKGDKTFRLNGEAWNDFDDKFYTTDANVDYAIDFIDEALKTKKPFFHYIAFNAPHYPLQAPKEDIQKYLGRYDKGWEAIREARFAKQKQLGIFPETMQLPPLPEHMPTWDSLSDHQRELESFRMAIFAAMVDRVDQNIGRLLEYLEEKGIRDNTLIMLCSDNGACPFERSNNLDTPPWQAGSYYVYDASWATVGNTPLSNYKQTQHEGGTSSPFIVNWPGQLKDQGRWENDPSHLIDIMATCIDVTDAQYPDNANIPPLEGKSMLPLFKGENRDGHEQLYFNFLNSRALRVGDWKLVSFYRQKWELYNLAEDRAEQNNLADQYPEKVESMATQWHIFAEHSDKLPAKQRQAVKDSNAPYNHTNWHRPDLTQDWVMPNFE